MVFSLIKVDKSDDTRYVMILELDESEKKSCVICFVTSLMCSWNLNRLACKKCNSAKEEINKFMKETERCKEKESVQVR